MKWLWSIVNVEVAVSHSVTKLSISMVSYEVAALAWRQLGQRNAYKGI
jgi:hypothetical protein